MKVTNGTPATENVVETWVKLYSDSLYTWALNQTSDKPSAEDLVQETFMTAHQQVKRFRADSSPKTWLFAILNNKIKEYYRKKYRETEYQHHTVQPSADILSTMFESDEKWRKDQKPVFWNTEETNLLDDKDFSLTLSSCLDKLPTHWRSAIHLKYIEEKKGELICQELNISDTNFWQILHRAKLQLRKCLEMNWFKL